MNTGQQEFMELAKQKLLYIHHVLNEKITKNQRVTAEIIEILIRKMRTMERKLTDEEIEIDTEITNIQEKLKNLGTLNNLYTDIGMNTTATVSDDAVGSTNSETVADDTAVGSTNSDTLGSVADDTAVGSTNSDTVGSVADDTAVGSTNSDTLGSVAEENTAEIPENTSYQESFTNDIPIKFQSTSSSSRNINHNNVMKTYLFE
jgi:hypothetical protein